MLTGSQSPSLVLASMIVAGFSSYTALDISGRIRAATKRDSRFYWLAGGTFAFATGLWAAHFIGMLAWNLPFRVSYNGLITARSFLIALIISWLTLDTSTRVSPSRRRIVLTGVATGIGYASIAYTGVQSLQLDPGGEYSTAVFMWAVLLAMGATTASLFARVRLVSSKAGRTMGRRALASALIGTALGGSHYIALAAVKVSPHSVSRTLYQIHPDHGGYAVIIGSVFIVSLALVLSVLEFRHERERQNLTSSLNEARQRLDVLASIDALTSLPNREAVFRAIKSEAEKPLAEGSGLHVLYINLDQFNVFNDSYGPAVGDSLLRAFGALLGESLIPGYLAGRIGGDEFVVVAPGSGAGDVLDLATRLVMSAKQGVATEDGRLLRIALSVGIAARDPDSDTADALLKNAGRAMFAVKDAGGNGCRFYSREMHENPLRRLQIRQALEDAVESGGFHLHFQPKFGNDGQSLEGAEALIRWTHPELGAVPPLEFIPVAESVGLINQIGNWVIEKACMQIVDWDQRGLPPIRIAVNLSPQQLKQPSFVRAVHDIVARHGVDPNRLMFEITETVAMEVAEKTASNIREFQAAGFDIAIDDFGTGYSSLAYLQRFRAKQLKIDRFFTRGLDDHGEEGYAIVEAIIGLAHTLKMQVVAEGVETLSQLEKLCEMQCDQLQGFLLGRPMDANAFEAFIRSRAALPA